MEGFRRSLTQTVSASREAWALILALPLAQVANLALSTVLSPLRSDLNLSYSELGILLAVFGIARIAMALPAGSIVQRFNPRPALLGSLMLIFVAAVVASTATSVWQVGFARILHGGSSAVVLASVLAWLVGGSTSANRGRVLALSEAFFSVVATIVPIGAGTLAGFLSWRAAYVVAAGAALVALAAVLAWTRADSAARAIGAGSARSGTPPDLGWRDLRRGGPLLGAAYLAGVAVYYGRHAVVSTLIPVVGADLVHLSPLQIGTYLSVLNFSSVGILLMGGVLGDRFGRRTVLLPGLLVLLGTQLALFLISGELSYFLVVVIQGLGFFINPLPTSLVGDALPAALRSRGIAVFRIIVDGVSLVGPVAIGFALEAGGFCAATLAGAAPTVAVIVAVLVLGARWPHSSAAAATSNREAH